MAVANSFRFRILIFVVLATLGWTLWPIPAIAGITFWRLIGHREDALKRLSLGLRDTKWMAYWWLVPVAIALGAVTVAISWNRIGGDLAPLFPFARPTPMIMALLVTAIAFVNASAEEILWRRVLLTEQSSHDGIDVWISQALSFGFAHWAGLPYGPLGIFSAALFSVGLLAITGKFGIFCAILVHWIVDVVVLAAVFQFGIYPPT